ncbi:MAG: PIG-L family deacetylase [Chloroflexi bacterium]|nr:PIG-L family deacetylase [Chloroflexota bacterium]MCA2003069.1 PIG-L family deacetylase [Chloroflexota bacterium]
MRYIYVSPHLDDAILSAGGLIYEQTSRGTEVEIWTVTAGLPPGGDLSPFAQAIHRSWGVPSAADVISARRAEDIKAAGIVGAKAVHFDFLDCIYRRDKDGNWLYDSGIFVPPHKEDVDFPARLAETLSTLLLPTDRLVCLFGIGSHVDHVLTRRAVETLCRPLYYLADVPYVFRQPAELGLHTAGRKAETRRISDVGFWTWLEAAAAYQSQLSSLFESRREMESLFQQYWSEYLGIRVWLSA